MVERSGDRVQWWSRRTDCDQRPRTNLLLDLIPKYVTRRGNRPVNRETRGQWHRQLVTRLTRLNDPANEPVPRDRVKPRWRVFQMSREFIL